MTNEIKSLDRQTRVYGLDILRIISILLITAIHYIGYSKILFNENILQFNYIILNVFSSLTVTAVNIFVLITGYFQCDKKATLKKAFKLWFQVFVLSVILCGFSIVFIKQVSLTELVKSFFPIASLHFWFLISYLILYLISPLLNIVIYNIKRVQHLLICLLGGIIACIYIYMNPFAPEAYLGNGHGFFWFAYLYFCGAYIRRYDISKKIKRKTPYITLLIFTIIFAIKYFKIDLFNKLLLSGNNSLLALLASLCVFIIFKDIKIEGKLIRSIISKFSKASFFIYIIQEHEMIRKWYWNLYNINGYADSFCLIGNFIISLLVLWPIALLYSKIYDLIFNNFFNVFYSKIEESGVVKNIKTYLNTM